MALILLLLIVYVIRFASTGLILKLKTRKAIWLDRTICHSWLTPIQFRLQVWFDLSPLTLITANITFFLTFIQGVHCRIHFILWPFWSGSNIQLLFFSIFCYECLLLYFLYKKYFRFRFRCGSVWGYPALAFIIVIVIYLWLVHWILLLAKSLTFILCCIDYLALL